VLLASLRREGPDEVVSPEGARATAFLDENGEVYVSVSCGAVLEHPGPCRRSATVSVLVCWQTREGANCIWPRGARGQM
jgi:hypothetical protein